MSFPTHPLPAKCRGGFALISVLALVSLAALTATAFLASARLERQATLPLGNALRLEWALTAGEMAAQQTISDATEPAEGTAKNFVATLWRGTNTTDWTKETGYLLIGEPNSTNNVRWTYYAGFSPAGLTNLTTNSIESALRFTNSHQGTYFSESSGFFDRATNGFTNNPAPTNPICTTIALLGGQTSPPVGWVYLTQRMRQKNSTNTSDVTSPVARVAWFIEDLSGKIDAEQMGGLSTNRLTGTNPEEICLTSMTRTNGSQILPSLTTFTNVTNRKLFFTPGLLAKSSISGLTNSDDLRYFATGLREFRPTRETNGMLDWIPCGIPVAIVGSSTNSYANGGYSKLSLNRLITLTAPSNVASIAAVIGNNLPNFKNRSGGMDGGAYVSNIAANIVDYVDTDSTPSGDSGANPTYLGIENIPWPNEIFTQLKHLGVTPAGILQIQMTDYLEVWNMGNKAITNNPTITISNNYDLILTITNTFAGASFKTNLNALTGMGGANDSKAFALSSTLLPNGYKVLTTTTNTHTLQITNPSLYSSPAVRNQWAIYAAEADATTNMSYTASVGTNVIQKTISGRWTRFLAPSFKMTPGRAYIFCNNIGYASQTAINEQPNLTGGDPRAQLFLSGALYNQNYTNEYASPGGRNVGRKQLGTYPESEVNPAKFWPDNGHATSSDYGGNPTAFNQSPTNFPPLDPPLTNNWVMKRNDTGALTNIIELGNIYDPMQWSDQAGSGVANQPGLWTNLTAAAIPDARFGGRNTLRIGRPEFTRFAFTNFAENSTPAIPNMGRSAAALLDLFCVSNGNTNGGPFRTGGKINLNTAPAPVLRALAGGILLTNDPALTGVGGSGTNFPVPASMAEAFAQGAMRFRSQYPFLTPSHLAFIGTDPGWPNTTNWPLNAVFGNTNSIALSSAPGNTNGTTARINVTAWNDQAAEEWFTKIYNLSTVQSDNYRVYIVAQLVDSNRTPISPVMRKYVQFFGRPNNSDDATNNEVYGVPMYYWPLTKGVKKAYESPY